MEEPNITVVHKTDNYPTGLKSAEEIANVLSNDISSDRILELAYAGYMPHYCIDGGVPQFRQTEVKQWVANNLLARNEGKSLHDAIRVVVPPPKMHDKPPESISNIQNIKQMPRHGYQPGVYFLCKDNNVIYVGQSVTPSSRIASHTRDSQKDFDRVYLLPVPQSELNDVEAAFIHHLQPIANGGLRSGRKPVAPVMSRPKGEILKSFNFDCGTV